MLNIVNFAHGAQYMLGAYVSWMLLTLRGSATGGRCFSRPILTGVVGLVLERVLIRRLYDKDHLYGLLLTFGLALVIQGLARRPVRKRGSSLQHSRRARRRLGLRLHDPADLPRLGDRAVAGGVSSGVAGDRKDQARIVSAGRH